MSAQDNIFNILRKIREAVSIISVRDQSSADPLVALSAVYYKLVELQAGPPDILFYQVETEVTNSVSLNKICERVKAECQEYHSLYLAHQEELDRWCSLMTIIQLVVKQAEREFSLRIHCANEEKNKRIKIFNKYNDITRLYNSRDDNRPIPEEDMRILDQYREELYDLVGHPIRLETVNDEHDKARAIVKQKWDELEILNKQKQSRAGELQGQIREGVTSGIDCFVENLSAAFKIDKSQTNSSKGRTGRPTNQSKYEKANIYDLSSCFVNQEYYTCFLEIIKQESKAMTSSKARQLFKALRSKNWLKSEMCSVQDFFDYFLKDDAVKEKLSPSTPVSAYNGEDVEGDYNYWIRLLSDNDHPEN